MMITFLSTKGKAAFDSIIKKNGKQRVFRKSDAGLPLGLWTLCLSKNQYRNGRSLRKYCKDEAIDYNWLMEFKKTYPRVDEAKVTELQGFIPLQVEEHRPAGWEVASLMLSAPDGSTLEIKSNSLIVVADLLQKMS